MMKVEMENIYEEHPATKNLKKMIFVLLNLMTFAVKGVT